ncbi:hypothetical protein FOC1_g10003760 [Fusarium oxysporum f. sp. cubense race 1]|uniref:Uncharacterized protein n=1 Tax=Fusarium oxysporum f. sp. cubense (strain race 1) TaxID=1229664 RepID=N4UH41_FUSC1|nr:hypothetical protein FOC1_g10003760 [Fusarium oxysporum f. sp. cubense race 1]
MSMLPLVWDCVQSCMKGVTLADESNALFWSNLGVVGSVTSPLPRIWFGTTSSMEPTCSPLALADATPDGVCAKLPNVIVDSSSRTPKSEVFSMAQISGEPV